MILISKNIIKFFWRLSIKICILPGISLLPFVYLLAQLRPVEILPSYFSFSLIDFSEIFWRHCDFSLDGVLLWASLSILVYLFLFWNNFPESCLYCYKQRHRLLFVHQCRRREIHLLCPQGWLASWKHNIIYYKSETWNMYSRIQYKLLSTVKYKRDHLPSFVCFSWHRLPAIFILEFNLALTIAVLTRVDG